MFGGIYFAGAPFGGALKTGAAAAALAASVSIGVSITADLSPSPAHLQAAATTIELVTARADLSVPIDTTAGIWIGGINVTARTRVQGATIHDILNDTPNTAVFQIWKEAPAVGQAVRIQIGSRVLFTGSIQTVDQAYESKPSLLVWHITAIDDTAKANARRPFGTWVDTSATTIAQALTTTYAPGFSMAGIESGLPPVSIVFDGADTLIACLARLATAVGGYCKIEQVTVYLFTEDTANPPAPIDPDHRFLNSPPIQRNIDSSQLRTRVYGKGYGETVATDMSAGETMLPIQDGATFPPLGGTAIVSLTAEGAQSDKIAFTGTVLKSGGSLVGTGASPTAAPLVALQGGAGTTSGVHTLSVAYRTAVGQSLAGPPATIQTGVHAPPATAPTAGPPTNGTGPDQGSHDYATSFVTAYGETVAGAISNAVTTSAASGQVQAPPIAPSGTPNPLVPGNLISTRTYGYWLTFTNAQGETENVGVNSGGIQAPGPPGPGQFNPGGLVPTTGGGMTPGTAQFPVYYYYSFTYVTAGGYETTVPVTPFVTVALGAGQTAVSIQYLPLHSDQRITKRRIYRSTANASTGPTAGVGGYLVVEIAGNTDPNVIYLDTMSDATLVGREQVLWSALPRGTDPGFQMHVSNIITGPAGVTGRKLYRTYFVSGSAATPPRLVTTIPNNTSTTFEDNVADTSLNIDMPTSNTTGTAVQRVPVTNIPIGPAGVTARSLYRRFNGAGSFKLVTTIANNTTTTFNDGVGNAALGAASLGTATAVGNQIAVTLPIGANAVTARELYMSPVSGPRRLIQTIGDNTTTAATVTIADGAITGVLEPTADSSGLQQPNGQVNPGSTVLPVASAAPYRPAGGWVTLGGGQVVKHTGISGNTLTGIPATGSGSITTAVLYGQQAIPAPMLIGVTGLQRAMLKGSTVAIWIQRDDLQAQAEQAARTGGDGVVEFLIVDQRRGVESLTARCDADLALFSRPIVTVQYATRDLKTRSGKRIVVDLPSQGLSEILTIQDVTITEIDIAPGLPPRFTVQASSVRFSLEDTLRRLVAVGPAVTNT